MRADELHGLIVPVVTPVDAEERVDEAAFRKILRYLIDAGVHGLFVGGSAGEGPLLTTDAWTRMMEIALDENAGKVSLLGGVMDVSTRKVKDKIQVLRTLGYEWFVASPTFYLTLKSPDEHLRLFGACRECGHDMKMMVYNIPSCVGSELPVDTICEMARRGWIEYCKESSLDFSYFKRLLDAANDVGLKLFLGDEVTIAEGLLAGACGIVPVDANYEPRTFIRAYQAALDGDLATLSQMQERIMLLREKLVMGGVCWLAGIKYAMSTLGMGSGLPISPLQPTEYEQKRAIDELTARRAG
jgi:4-hydroxy-tetrahydrodipicolinate synthase